MKYLDKIQNGEAFYDYAKGLAILNENLEQIKNRLDEPERLQAKNAQLGVLIAMNKLVNEFFEMGQGASTTSK